MNSRGKRVCDLEDDVKELEAVNKRLKEELKNSNKRVSRSSKGEIRNSNGWTGNKAILADKVTKFSRDYMFPRYKFFEGRMAGLRSNKQKELVIFCREENG